MTVIIFIIIFYCYHFLVLHVRFNIVRAVVWFCRRSLSRYLPQLSYYFFINFLLSSHLSCYVLVIVHMLCLRFRSLSSSCFLFGVSLASPKNGNPTKKHPPTSASNCPPSGSVDLAFKSRRPRDFFGVQGGTGGVG